MFVHSTIQNFPYHFLLHPTKDLFGTDSPLHSLIGAIGNTFVSFKVTLNVDYIRRQIIHGHQAQETIRANNLFHEQHPSPQQPSHIQPFNYNASIITTYPNDLILEFVFPPVPSYYNFTYYLTAWHNSVKINSASETVVPQFYTFSDFANLVIQNAVIPWEVFESWDAHTSINLLSFKQRSKKLTRNLPLADSISYSKSKMAVDDLIWGKVIHKLSQLHNQHHILFNEIFELQVGLLNKCFYHPCSFCGIHIGGPHHVLFEGAVAKHIIHLADCFSLSLHDLVGVMLSDNQFLQANKIVKLLMFMSKRHFPLRLENPSLTLSDDQLVNAINQFGYKSFA